MGATAGLAAGTGLFMKTGKEETKKREQIPGETGIEKDKKVLDAQIKFLDSLVDKDFEAISKGSTAQEREAEFARSVDKRFNAAIEISPDIAQESRSRILAWFRGLEARQRNTTVKDLREARDRTREHLEERLDFYNTGKRVNPPDKLSQ